MGSCKMDIQTDFDGLEKFSENYRSTAYDTNSNPGTNLRDGIITRLKRGANDMEFEKGIESEYLDELPGHSFDENVASWAVLNPSDDYDDDFIAKNLGDTSLIGNNAGVQQRDPK